MPAGRCSTAGAQCNREATAVLRPALFSPGAFFSDSPTVPKNKPRVLSNRSAAQSPRVAFPPGTASRHPPKSPHRYGVPRAKRPPVPGKRERSLLSYSPRPPHPAPECAGTNSGQRPDCPETVQSNSAHERLRAQHSLRAGGISPLSPVPQPPQSPASPLPSQSKRKIRFPPPLSRRDKREDCSRRAILSFLSPRETLHSG